MCDSTVKAIVVVVGSGILMSRFCGLKLEQTYRKPTSLAQHPIDKMFPIFPICHRNPREEFAVAVAVAVAVTVVVATEA